MKGFTTVELIAVVVILAVISLIAVPTIINLNSDTQEKQIKRDIETIYTASEHYVLAHNIDDSTILVIDLINEGYLDSDFLDPFSQEKFTASDTVTVSKDENKEFKFSLNSNNQYNAIISALESYISAHSLDSSITTTLFQQIYISNLVNEGYLDSKYGIIPSTIERYNSQSTLLVGRNEDETLTFSFVQ